MLTGCISHTHAVQQPKMPTAPLQNATAQQLVDQINQANQSTQSLKATVLIQLSVGGAKKGKITDYTSLSGYIRLRQPELLRVLGLLPVLHTQAFDLASDGKTFKLVIPHNNKAYIGTNTGTGQSSNPIENLRPSVFFDTLLLRSIAPDSLVYLTSDNPTHTDPKTGEVSVQPEYELTILRRKQNSQELIPERRIHFDRTTLQPSSVDIYDEAGTVQTEAIYGPYASFGDVRYPATITIRRPVEEYQILLTFQQLTKNQPLPESQFELNIPTGYTVQDLH